MQLIIELEDLKKVLSSEQLLKLLGLGGQEEIPKAEVKEVETDDEIEVPKEYEDLVNDFKALPNLRSKRDVITKLVKDLRKNPKLIAPVKKIMEAFNIVRIKDAKLDQALPLYIEYLSLQGTIPAEDKEEKIEEATKEPEVTKEELVKIAYELLDLNEDLLEDVKAKFKITKISKIEPDMYDAVYNHISEIIEKAKAADSEEEEDDI